MNTAFGFCSDDGGPGWGQQGCYTLPGRKGLLTRQTHCDSAQRPQGGKVTTVRCGDRALPGGGAAGHGLLVRAMWCMQAGVSPVRLPRPGGGGHRGSMSGQNVEGSRRVISGHARHLHIIMARQGMLCRVHHHGRAALHGCSMGKSRDTHCKQQTQDAHDKAHYAAGHGLNIPHGGIYSK
jgi:hypothetical protein